MSRARELLRSVAPPIVVGVLLRVALVVVFPDVPLFGDELHFQQSARDILAGDEVTNFPFRPPLYVAFCAAVMALLGPAPDGIRFVQCGLEGLAILGVFLLARRTLGQRAATWAAWLWALFPDLLWFSTTLWSESLSVLLLVWGSLALVALSERPSRGRALLVGLAWGALSLVKPAHLYLLPLLLGWLVILAERPRGPTWRACGLALAVAVLVITPWSVYQSVKQERPILICTTGPKNLASGVNYAPPAQFDYASRWNLRDAERRDGRQREVGVVAFILEHPRLFVHRAWQKMSYLWSPNSFLVRHVYSDLGDGSTYKYGDPAAMPAAARLGAVWLTVVANLLVSLAFLAGLFLAGEKRLTGLAAIYCLGTMGMITLTPSLSRYRLPLMVFALCFAGWFLASRLDLRHISRVRLAGLGACVLVMLAWWSLRVPDLLAAIW